MIIRSKRIICEDTILDGYLEIENHQIKGIYPSSACLREDYDYSDYRIIPGIFDTHNHGVNGYSMETSHLIGDKKEIVKGYLKALASQGVTAIFPTCSIDLMSTVAQIAQEEHDGARIVGIHSEGPYLNRVGENGIYDGMPTIDLDVYKTMIKESKGYLKLVGLAPEIPNADEAIAYLTANGVKVTFAHSNADYQQAMDSFEKGISVSTHTANVMSGIHHRHMGGLGACLLSDIHCEIICDFFHVSKEMIELMFKVKDHSKWMMISDNIALANAPVGKYCEIGGHMTNITSDGFSITDTGRLMGSTKPILYGIYNLVEKLGMSIVEVCKMSSLNACDFYGIKNKGSLKEGKDADFVVIDDDYHVIETYREGVKVYDSKKDGLLLNYEYLNHVRVG